MSNGNGISITKRGGQTESLKIEKIHKMVDAATKGINGVSASQVEISANLSFYDGITTEEIQQTLIKSAAEKISPQEPDYDIYAGRLLVINMRKQVYGGYKPLPFLNYIKTNVENKLLEESRESFLKFIPKDTLVFSQNSEIIYKALDKYVTKEIHALQMITKTKQEYSNE